MASNVIRVSILADAKRFKGGLREAETGLESFKRKAGLVAKGIVAAFAIKALQGVKNFVGGSIDEFNSLNESLNALEVVYGEHADGIKEIGERAAESLGQSNSEFNQFATSISAFAKQIAGDGGDVVGTVDDLSTRVADFASVMDMDFGEAAAKFRSGLAGESEPLRKFGIDVSAAKVEQVALNEGIWDGVGAMTEAEKVTARYETIMQQTSDTAGDFANTSGEAANKERILNARMRDQQALLGQGLLPLWEVWLDTQEELIPAIGKVAIEVGALSGAISEGEAALMSFKNETGEAADSISDVLKGVELSWQSWTKEIDVWEDALFGGTNRVDDMVSALEGLLDEQDITREGLEDLKDELQETYAQGDLTKEQYAALSRVLDTRLNSSLTDQEQAARDALAANREYRAGLEEVEGQSGDTEDQTRSTTDALREQDDQLRAMSDPMFAAIQATKDIEEAQENYNEAVKEHGPNSREAIEASEDLMDANLDLREAFIDLQEQGIDPTSEAARNMLRDVGGLSPQQIDAILGTFRSIQNRMPVLDLSVRAPNIHYTARGNNYTPHRNREFVFHEGEHRVPGLRGQDVPAILQGGEQVLSATEAERRRKGNGEGNGAGTVVNITVEAGISDPYAVAKKIGELLQQYNRVSGPLNLDVRTL